MTSKIDRQPISRDEKTRYWAEAIYKTAAAIVSAYARAEKRGINQEVIADRLEKDKSQISRWLSGERNMTIKSISELALAMECDLKIELVDINSIPTPNFRYSLPATTDTASRPVSAVHLTSEENQQKTFANEKKALFQSTSAN